MMDRKLASDRGVATKDRNRYRSLFVFLRKFLDMDDNEWLPLILRTLKSLQVSITRKAFMNHQLVHLYLLVA